MEQPLLRRGWVELSLFYVAVQNGYVNLGFYEGARLDDPEGLLEGTGEAMRHVKIRSADTLENPVLTELVKSAATQCRG